MSNEPESVDDLAKKIDAAVLNQSGWYPSQTEVVSAGSAGHGFAALDMRTPLLELLEKEMGEEESEMDRWVQAAILIIRAAVGNGSTMPSLMQIGKTIALWAQDAGLEPFASMTQQGIANLTEIDCPHCGEVVQAAQTRSALSAQHKRKVQGPKVAAGCKAYLTKGQKPAGLVSVYKARATGNSNRRMAEARKRVAERLAPPE